MMAGHGDNLAVGGPARHIPVLLPEVVAALSPMDGKLVVDGTFGAGGYTRALLEAGATVVAFDRDPDAIEAGRSLAENSDGRLTLVHDAFSRLGDHVEAADAVVLDIGVSSMQLDRAERGFSFRTDGPLDMRMARRGPSAADVVNTYKSGDLARIIGFYSEERNAGRIARMIENRREKKPFQTTLELAHAIETLIGRGPKDKIHPATRVFQALRIYVNDELGELAKALFAAERILRPGGQLAVVSFHSLEDRMVKRFMADRSENPAGSRHLPETGVKALSFDRAPKPVSPSETEIELNPRARSARLRVALRNAEPPRPADPSIFGLPNLPELSAR
jgi:16S rRNA (cytosine1402-N4)-methyltransferase